jgi:hypothetical protein
MYFDDSGFTLGDLSITHASSCVCRRPKLLALEMQAQAEQVHKVPLATLNFLVQPWAMS